RNAIQAETTKRPFINQSSRGLNEHIFKLDRTLPLFIKRCALSEFDILSPMGDAAANGRPQGT
ncbi:MAG: hypothetical protein ACO3BO_02835, partial [Anaerohalosphaeraceae bacterium]